MRRGADPNAFAPLLTTIDLKNAYKYYKQFPLHPLSRRLAVCSLGAPDLFGVPSGLFCVAGASFRGHFVCG